MDQDASRNREELPQPDAPSGQHIAPKKPRWWRRRAMLECLQALFSLSLVGVTAYQGYLTRESLRLTQRAVQSAEQQAQAAQAANTLARDSQTKLVSLAQEANNLTREAQKQTNDLVANADRPWVGVHDPQESDFVDFEAEKKVGIILRIFNVGKTPASIILNKSLRLMEGGTPGNVEFYDAPEKLTLLFPNQTIERTAFLAEPVVLPTDNFMLLKSGSHTFIISAQIEYKDGIERPHKTTVCYVFQKKAHAAPFSPCETGTSAY